jgi:hypothetical protein
MQKRKIWKRRRRGWSIYVEWSFELQWEEQGWWRRSCKFVKINFYASKPSIFKTYYYKIITALIYHYVFGPAPLRTEFWSARWRCSKLGVWWEHSWLLLALQESLTGQGQPVIRNWNQNQLMMNDMEDVTNLHHSARIIRKYVEFRIRHGSSVHLSTIRIVRAWQLRTITIWHASFTRACFFFTHYFSDLPHVRNSPGCPKP